MKPIIRPIDTSNIKELVLETHDDERMKLDKNGYFLIRINKEKKIIELGFCGYDNKMRWKVEGKNPKDLIKTALKQEPISDFYHAAYLGRELQKATIALDNNKEYVQDEELS